MNDGDLRLPGITTRRPLEVTAAQIDDAVVPAGEGEHSRIGALRAPSPVEEDDQPEIALCARAQFPQLLGQRQTAFVVELGQYGLTGWFRQPLGCNLEGASRGVASERIVNVYPSPGKIGGRLVSGVRPGLRQACLGRGWQPKAGNAEHRDGASSNRCMAHAIDPGAP